jgi:hypothetical protein
VWFAFFGCLEDAEVGQRFVAVFALDAFNDSAPCVREGLRAFVRRSVSRWVAGQRDEGVRATELGGSDQLALSSWLADVALPRAAIERLRDDLIVAMVDEGVFSA